MSVLRRLELIGLHDLDAAGVRAEALGHVAEDGDPLAQLDHERPQVENDHALFGADRTRVVLEHVDQLPVRARHSGHPQGLHAGTLEHAHRRAVGELTQAGGRRPG